MGSPSRNVQYHPPRLSEDRLNLPQPHSPSLPTHCTAPGNRECARDDLAERLRADHPGILATLQDERALLDKVDEPHRATIERWMQYFQQRPLKLREEAAERLKRKSDAGIKKTRGRGGYKDWAWLHWWETLPSDGDHLGIGDCTWWWFSFEPRNVTVELGTPLHRNPKNPKMQEVWSFLQATPIDPDRAERYPMEVEHRVIYRHSLLKDAELSGPFEESVKLLHHRMDQFFGPEGDYERIERYFRCLAFDPRGPREPADGETAP